MAGETVSATNRSRNADLPVRVASAAVMLAVAVAALWAGDPWLDIFIALVVLVGFGEFVRLVAKAAPGMVMRLVAILFGAAYMGFAGLFLSRFPVPLVVGVVGTVICVDVFAYFFGRTLGGPKIAPAISPSKTWAGLLGAIVGATGWIAAWIWVVARGTSGDNTIGFEGREIAIILGIGVAAAVAAQTGDFFESWLKRRAGVKDSSNLIPGHGGVFDRIDGMIPVVLLAGVLLGAGR